MKLSLIIPCYNEEKSIPLLLEHCKSIVSNFDAEVVFVNNGSTDATKDILLDLLPRYAGCRSIDIDVNVGYGHGIISGLKSAKGEILAWTHADLQTHPNDIVRGIDFFEKNGVDIFVKGNRYGRPLFDNLFTVLMSIFETILLRKLMWDINAQPTMFSRNFFHEWESVAPFDFSLDLFVYYYAKKKKIDMYRFPVDFSPRVHGKSHWNVDWRSKLKFIIRTVKFSVNMKRNITL